MLRVMKQTQQVIENQKGEIPTFDDIIVETWQEIDTEREDGVREVKIKRTKTNLTKQINETAKLMKQNNAEAKLAEIEQIFSK